MYSHLYRSLLCALAVTSGLASASPEPGARQQTPAPTIIATTRDDAKLPPVKAPEFKQPTSGLVPADPRKLLDIFGSYVGIKEKPLGSNNGPEVDKFNASCGLKPSQKAPWCASVARYGYNMAGAPGRPGAYSPDWYKKTRVIPADMVQPGDVGLIYFPSKGRYAHTIACIEKVNKSGRVITSYVTLEGNTNAQGSREGDQFARRIRPADTVTVVRWLK